MALEAGTYVQDLNSANPPGSDPKSQGDDHLRLIKTVLDNTFPTATQALKPLIYNLAQDPVLNETELAQARTNQKWIGCEGYLTYGGGNIVLTRKSGRFISINGTVLPIPAATVTLAGTGTSAGTAYYIYAYSNAGTLTLELSTTAWAVDATTGCPIKTADATRVFLGVAYAPSNNTWSTAEIELCNYWNPEYKEAASTPANTTEASTSLTELNGTATRRGFTTITGRRVVTKVSAIGGADAAGRTVSLSVAFASVGAHLPAAVQTVPQSATDLRPMLGDYSGVATQGYNYVRALGAVSAGIATLNQVYTIAGIFG